MEKRLTNGMRVAFEFIDFYPDPNPKKRLGTCHVYDCDAKMDIRGIRVFIFKKSIMYLVPGERNIEDGKSVFYPYIGFTDPKKKKQLIDTCQKHCTPLVKKLLKGAHSPA